MAEIINTLTQGSGFQRLELVILCYFAMSIVQQLIVMRQNHMSIDLDTRAGYGANRYFLKKLYHTSYTEISGEDPAMLNQKLSNDIGGVVSFSLSFYRDVISNVLFIICIMVVLLSQSLSLCLVLILLTGCYVLIYLTGRDRIYQIGCMVRERQTDFFGKLYSMLYFMKSVRNNGFETIGFKQQDKAFSDYRNTLDKQVTISNGIDLATNLISLLAETLLFLIGGKLVLDHQIQVGLLVAVMNYFSILLQSTDYFLGLGQSYQDVRASYDRLLPYDTIEEAPDGYKRLDQIKEIALHGVHFTYPGKEKLFRVYYKFERGNIYWIEGKNGIGKTTLMNLMLGLYGKLYGGSISVNGVEDEEINFASFVENNSAVVEQEPYLLTDTLRYNMLCKTKWNKEEELKDLLELFEMNIFIDKQPEGMDTIYNSMNSTLSGGEKQKIAILRMFLSDADLWFLDEPTSALDAKSTERFYQELDKRKENHIIIMISHERPECEYKILRMSEFNHDMEGVYFEYPLFLYN